MAAQNDVFKEASDTVFILSADAQIQKRCRDREDYYADIRSMQKQAETYKKKYDDAQQQLDAERRMHEEERLKHEADTKAQTDEITALKKYIAELEKHK